MQRRAVNSRNNALAFCYLVAGHYVDVIALDNSMSIRMLGVFHAPFPFHLRDYLLAGLEPALFQVFPLHCGRKHHEEVDVVVAGEPCLLAYRTHYHAVAARHGLCHAHQVGDESPYFLLLLCRGLDLRENFFHGKNLSLFVFEVSARARRCRFHLGKFKNQDIENDFSCRHISPKISNNESLKSFISNYFFMAEYVSHPWINAGTIEKRSYQDHIANAARQGNLLCVLPTGMGKTQVAALVAAERLQKNMNAKILFMAPTKPLVDQHRNSFERMLKIGEDELKTVTGSDKPEDRKELYQKADIVFSTPQTIENDVKEG